MRTSKNNSLLGKLTRSSFAAGLGLSTMLFSGCTSVDEQGRALNADGTLRHPPSTQQQNYAANADDANLSSGFFEVLAGAAGLRSPGAGLLLSAVAGVAGREAIIEGQKAAAEQGAPSVRQENNYYRFITHPVFGIIYVDQVEKIASGKGIFIKIFPDGTEGTFVTCNYIDAHGKNELDEMSYIGLNNVFSSREKITIASGFERMNKMQGNHYYKLQDSKGEIVGEETKQLPSFGELYTYGPKELAPGKYTATWYLDNQFTAKLEFLVTE